MNFIQVTEGLTFLHNDVKLVHSNLCPSSLILNKSGAWKIAGFDFCIRNANTTDQAVSKSGRSLQIKCTSIIENGTYFVLFLPLALILDMKD